MSKIFPQIPMHKAVQPCHTNFSLPERSKNMTKKYNRGSSNQNSPQAGRAEAEFAAEFSSGDNSKGNKRNKGQQSKTKPHK
jgi:hypothetical protein